MSKSARKSTRITTKRTAANHAAQAPPWVLDGINYDPALAAINDLATWAFEVAADNVADWPQAARRVRNAQRFTLSRIQGTRARAAPLDDVLFTAALLARIFDAELSLGAPEMITILDQLGLPTDVVPVTRRRPTTPNVTPLRPRPQSAVRAPLSDSGCACRGFQDAA